jgi:hypothetical protein
MAGAVYIIDNSRVHSLDLPAVIIGGQHGRAEIEQFHGPAFSLDRGHYAFPVVARGQFAPGSICIGIAIGERIPTWINGSSTGRGDLQLYYAVHLEMGRRK